MDSKPWEVAVVSSSIERRQDVAGMLLRLGLDPICISSVDQCHSLRARPYLGLVFCDRRVKGGDYRDVLSAVNTADTQPIENEAKVVMMADLDTPEEYQQARQQGLFDVIPSPCRATDVEWMVIQAKRNRRPAKELLAPSRNLSLLWKAAGAGA
jgi:DNA-binding NtrC family response regulator